MNNYLKTLINSNPNIPIGFNCDGTLFEARWMVKRITIEDDSEEALLDVMSKTDFLYTEPIPFMKKFVSYQIHSNNVFVISEIHNNVEFEHKTRELHQHYRRISRLFWAKSMEDKIKHLDAILKDDGEFIYIDGDLKEIIALERHFNNPNCYFFHSSSLIV